MKVFGLQEKGTNFVSEILAGITAFITVSYLPLQCAQIMSGDQTQQVSAFVAICISSLIGCLLMGFMANQPFVVGPSVGMVTFFTATLLGSMKYSFAQGMSLVMIASAVFLLLSITGLQSKITSAVPSSIKNAISAGLGIYIALLGLRNAGFLSISENGNWALLDFSQHTARFFTTFILFGGLVLIGMCKRFNMPVPILIGIIASGLIYYAVGIPAGYVNVNNSAVSISDVGSQFSLWAANSLFKNFTTGISKLFGSMELSVDSILTLLLLTISCALFNSMESTCVVYATARNSGKLDDGGNFPELKKTMTANSIGSLISSCVGCPAVSVMPESNAGTAVNGKTGLTAVTAGVMFLGAIIFAPLFVQIPTFVTASALVYIGIIMMAPIKDVDFSDINESIPAFVTMIVIPFTSSIIDGIALGLIMHIVINVCTFKFKSINVIELIIALIFAANYFLI